MTLRLLLAAFLLVGCEERIEESSSESVLLPPMNRLEADIHDGEIRFRGSEGPARLVIERRAIAGSEAAARAALDRLAVTIRSDPETGALLVTSHDAAWGVPAFLFGESVSLTLTFHVPSPTPARLRARDGDLDIEDFSGPLDAFTADGRVIASRVGTEATTVRLGSGDGRIEGRGLRGEIEAETADGSIRLEGQLGKVHAVTGDGRVAVRLSGAERLSGDWLLRSADGGVSLVLPETLAARFDITAGDGLDDRDRIPNRNAPFYWGGPPETARIRIVAPGGRVRIRDEADPEN